MANKSPRKQAPAKKLTAKEKKAKKNAKNAVKAAASTGKKRKTPKN